MLKRICCTAAALLAHSTVAHAQEPGATPIPAAVAALAGCWDGRGEVMGKSVRIAISARSIVQNAMLALDADSSAVADPKDRYAAHLIFGGTDVSEAAPGSNIVGFWADSFGGAFTATGRGESRSDGFDMTYRYPHAAFVNRWRPTNNRLSWQIVARNAEGIEKPFASYLLRKVPCRGTPRL